MLNGCFAKAKYFFLGICPAKTHIKCILLNHWLRERTWQAWGTGDVGRCSCVGVSLAFHGGEAFHQPSMFTFTKASFWIASYVASETVMRLRTEVQVHMLHRGGGRGCTSFTSGYLCQNKQAPTQIVAFFLVSTETKVKGTVVRDQLLEHIGRIHSGHCLPTNSQ